MQSTQTIQKPKISITHEQLYAEISRRSFYQFVIYFWDTVIAETPIWNWHVKYLCDQLQAIGERVKERKPKEFDYFLINVPPGSSKSTIISEMYPVWCWTIDATQRFICGSYASTPAEDIAEKCYKIYTSDKYKRLFPHLHGKKAGGGKTKFSNGLGGERYTTSTGSGITGIHAHQLIVDDPMSPQIAASQTERERANKWVQETLSSRKVSQEVTVTIIVMQRLHELDTTGYLLKKEEEGLRIKHICIPAELSNDVKPAELRNFYVDGLFDPVRRTRQSLLQARLELGSYGYAGQMQQRPSPAEGGIIKKHWFAIIQRDRLLDYTIPHFQLDTAYTEDEENDPTAVVCYYMENDKVHVYNRISVWKEFPDLIKWLPEYVTQNGYTNRSKIYVEPKASGKSVVQTIRKGTKLNIIESAAPDDDKMTRAHIVSPKIESGQVILHAGQWSDPFVNQITSFPNAQHDDEFDCLIAIIMRELMVEKKTKKKLGGFFH
ncbi:phage terminase large subunit [Danxiaibacter flavus]|uniref:Phage terminase large subunit n=1 Tax=Danxiaibacter flavus TaxID=3049108 RepID=A0ABV3ZPP9_9BACT|nr:phage terminase large subunit [Chitinophagaceae bacterium DXS]